MLNIHNKITLFVISMFIEKTPGDLSQEIKMKRESLGLSLEDVFEKTRIRSIYLQAIENKEFHLLPGPVYTKNFIKTYAKFLGLDEKPILQDYDAYIHVQKEERIKPQAEISSEEKQYFGAMSHKKSYWGLLLVLIIVFIAWLIFNRNIPVSDEIGSLHKVNVPVTDVKQQESIAVPNTTTVDQHTTGNADVKNTETEKGQPVNASEQSSGLKASINKNVAVPLQPTQAASVGGQKNVLLVIAIEETWIRIKEGENPSTQMVLKPGEKFESKGDVFKIDIGNAGGIKLQYKGKYIENLGKRGDVVHLQLPPLQQ